MKLEQQELEMAEGRSDLSARELWEVEDYLGNKVCRSSSTTSRSTPTVFPKMAASPSVRRLQIGNGCRSVGTFTSEDSKSRRQGHADVHG